MVKKLLDAAKYRASLQTSSKKDTTQVNNLKREAMELNGEVELKPYSNSVKRKNDTERANRSPKNEVVTTKQQVNDSGEATGSPSSGICNSISQVEMIYSKRMKNLLSYQSERGIEFKKEKERIEKDLKATLENEHSYESARVRMLHLQFGDRLVEMRNVDEEYIRKLEVIRSHLYREQEKLNSLHKAARKEEKELKYHWLEEAKSGRPVDMFSVLPQFFYSYFNLDDLKNYEQLEKLIHNGTEQFQVTTTANSPSEPLLLNSSSNENSALPHAMQLELPATMDSVSELVRSNVSEGDIPLTMQLQRTLPTEPSEPGSGAPVLENSLLCQVAKEENHVQLKLEEDLASICRVEAEDCKRESQVRRDREPQQPHECCNLAPQPPSCHEMEEQQRLTKGNGKNPRLKRMCPGVLLIREGAEGSYAHEDTKKSGLQVSNDQGHLSTNTGLPDEARALANQRSVAQRKRREREADQACHCAEMGAQQAEKFQERTTYMSPSSLAQRKPLKREEEEARQSAVMGAQQVESFQEITTTISPRSLAQRKRREREAEQALHCAEIEIVTPKAENFQERTTTISPRPLAQRKRREREAELALHCAEMGTPKARHFQERTTYMSQRTLSQRQRRERDAAQARQCAEMEAQQAEVFQVRTPYISRRSLAQRKRREREAQQARKCVEMGAQQAANFQERTTYISRRSLAQRRPREREAEQACQWTDMGAQRAANFQERTTYTSRRSLAQRRRREREAELAHQK